MAVGIIAEYNPFHNGHLYQIKKIKEMYQDEEIILVLSGNFTERGIPSIINKWQKVDIAKHFGIDLIVELPFYYATQSADFFAEGAISILENLKVDKLIFGSENDDIKTLEIIAKCQIDNPDFDKLVKIYLRTGLNYPTAISNAVYDLTGEKIDTPNDLLGISYIKTILKNNYKIEPITIKREDNYHSEDIKEISSATAIRKALKEKKEIKDAVPEYVYSILKKEKLHYIDDYFRLLKYRIITEDNLEKYKDIDEGLDSLLKKSIIETNSYDELIKKVKTKRYTHNKISRALLHILIGLKKVDNYSDKYIRILDFNNKGRDYLNKVKKESKIEILSKFKRNNKMLELELKSTIIYDIPYNEDLGKYEYRNNIKGEENDKN